jgi:tRNA(Ile)-lysidine synthase
LLSRPDPSLDPGRLFAGFEDLSALLLAVSGGPDSLALMRLAAQWPAPRPKLFVATVDHGLRAESADEARRVAGWAAELGLPHATLPWLGDKPARAVQEKARAARYALLFAHAENIGAQAVVTAHHADDQWETVIFRLTRGSGIGGLAGMARDQNFRQGRLIRPLLGLPKQALIAYCRAAGQEFIDDPSNANPAFARARLRNLAAQLETLGLTREKAATLAERAKKADEAVDWAADQLLARMISPETHVYDLALMGDAPRAAFERFLRRALERAAGAAPQRLDRLESLADKLDFALRRGEAHCATLGGCAVTLTRDRRLAIRAETPRRRGRNPVLVKD